MRVRRARVLAAWPDEIARAFRSLEDKILLVL
jgi:hypothetical protein